MTQMRKFSFIVVFLIIFSFFPRYSFAIDAIKLIAEVNSERITNGLTPLVQDNKLNNAALQKAISLTKIQSLSHTKSQEGVAWSFIKDAGYVYGIAGENLAVNFQNEEEVISHWMNSPSHRANILRSDFTDVGVAITEGKYDGRTADYVVMYFAQPNLSLQREAQIKALKDMITYLSNLLFALQSKML